MRTTVLIAISLTSHFLGSALLAEPPTPTLHMTPTTVEAAGMTPGGDVVVVGAVRYSERAVTYRWQGAESLADGDLDGAVSWTPEPGMRQVSAWVAIDLATGRHAAAFGAPTLARALNLPEAPLVRSTGRLRAFSLPQGNYQLALVRPGIGAWQGLVSDRELSANELGAVGVVSKAPSADPQVGDILVVIDLDTVRVLIKELAAGDFAAEEEE
jgi:hypothetical protein